MKNFGLNLEKEVAEQSSEDWVFGASSQRCLAQIPENEREQYLPKGEIQKGLEDTMDCASRGPINILETKFTYLCNNGYLKGWPWLIKNGYTRERGIVEFSDAFVAINSGTTRRGNSLKAPLEAIRKKGLIPKSMLPLEKTMTFSEYHDPGRITKKMRKLGEEFLKRFTINYEKVYDENYEKLLEQCFLNVAGLAWPNPVKGEYPKVNFAPNHCFILFKNPMFYAFDNYEESSGDFIKKLAPDYQFFRYGYRLYISERILPKKNRFLLLIKRLCLLKNLF